MSEKSTLAEAIIESLNSEDWQHCEYTATSPGNLKIWTANLPILNIEVWRPAPHKFSLIEKFRIFRALKRNRERVLTKKVKP